MPLNESEKLSEALKFISEKLGMQHALAAHLDALDAEKDKPEKIELPEKFPEAVKRNPLDREPGEKFDVWQARVTSVAKRNQGETYDEWQARIADM